MTELALSPDRLLSRAEVEVSFGLSRRFLEIAAVRGDGPPMVKIGRSVRYRSEDLRVWIEARRVTSTSHEVGK
jgi:predicted DNA-binding transcriptional regulator AlpA